MNKWKSTLCADRRHKSTSLTVKRTPSTTTQRRGAICIIIDNADEDNHNSKTNNMTPISFSSGYCDIEDDEDDDDDDNDDGGVNDDDYDYDYDDYVDDCDRDTVEAGVDVINNEDTYSNTSAHDNNNIRSREKMLRRTNTKPPNAKPETMSRKKRKQARILTDNMTVHSATDDQEPTNKYNFWHNLLVTPKNGKSSRFIDYFRTSSRDIQRKTGEG